MERSSLEVLLGDPGYSERWTIIQKGGTASKQVSCNTTDGELLKIGPHQAAIDLLISRAVDPPPPPPSIAFEVWKAQWKNLFGSNDEAMDPLTLSNFRVNVTTLGQLPMEPSLRVYTEPRIDPNQGEVTLDEADPLRIVHVCTEPGDAEVVLNMSIDDTPLCYKYVKSCQPTWQGLVVKEVDTDAFIVEDGQVTEKWRAESSHAISRGYLTMLLSHPSVAGSLRIAGVRTVAPPEMDVQVRGALSLLPEGVVSLNGNASPATGPPATIGNGQREILKILYKCQHREGIEGTLGLELINENPLTPPLKIYWHAVCVPTPMATDNFSVTAHPCADESKTIASYENSLWKRLPGPQEAASATILQSPEEFLVVPKELDCLSLKFTSTASPEPNDEQEVPLPHHADLLDKASTITNRANLVVRTATAVGLDSELRVRLMFACRHQGNHLVSMSLSDPHHLTMEFIKQCAEPMVHHAGSIEGPLALRLVLGFSMLLFIGVFVTRSRSLVRFAAFKARQCWNR